jgi:hypothetical protein
VAFAELRGRLVQLVGLQVVESSADRVIERLVGVFFGLGQELDLGDGAVGLGQLVREAVVGDHRTQAAAPFVERHALGRLRGVDMGEQLRQPVARRETEGVTSGPTIEATSAVTAEINSSDGRLPG